MSTVEPHGDKLQYIFDNARVGIAVCNAIDNTLEMVNPAFAAIHGYEPHELIGVAPGEVFAPECMLRLSEYENTSTCPISDISFETTHIRKDGSSVPVSVHITLIKDENGVVKQRITNIIDITKRKNAESELRLTNERFNQIYENAIDVIYLIEVTPEGRFIHLDINPAYVEVSGMAREEIIGRYVDEFENEPFRTILLEKYGSCLKAGKRIDYTNDYPFPSGTKTFHSVLTPLFDEEGRIHQIVGVARDITERKEQEERLHKIKAKLSAIISTIPDLIWVKDAEGVYMMCNPAFENFFGAECSRIVGKTDYDFLSTEQADFFRQEDIKVLKSGEMRINEEEIIFANNGERALLETRKVPVYNGEEFMGILGIAHDITEKKRMEQLVIQNESRLKEAQKIAKVGSWELEFPGFELSWSDEIFRIFEIDPDKFQPSYEYFLNAVHPEDRPIIDAAFADSLKNKTPYDIVHRLLMEDGRIKYVHERGKTLYDKEGNPIRSIGTVQDITKQKSVEKKIHHMAHHDALTGLPNRTLAKIRAEQIIAHAKRVGSKVAFLFIDLDGFKAINDTLGHSIGDLMLRTVASRLKECFRERRHQPSRGG